jgi:hypothetical protein
MDKKKEEKANKGKDAGKKNLPPWLKKKDDKKKDKDCK